MTVRKLMADVEAVRSVVPRPLTSARTDPLLAAVEAARSRLKAADEEIRLLLAYARRFVYPHPYTLGELGAAAGMSVSGVRTAFCDADVRRVSEATGLDPAPGEDRGD